MKLKNLGKSIFYCFNLMYTSSRLMIGLYIIINFIIYLFPLFNAFVLKNILNELTLKNPDVKNIYFLIIIYIISLVLLQGIIFTKKVTYNYTYEKSRIKYYAELYRRISILPMAFIDTADGRNTVDDVFWIADTAVNLTYQIIDIVSMFFTFIVAYATLASFNFGFSVLFIILTIPAVIMDIIYNRKADVLRRKMAPDKRKINYYRWILTDVSPAKDVRMYNLTDDIKKRYDEEKDIYYSAENKLSKNKLAVNFFTETVKRSGEIIFTIFVIINTIKGKIAIGDMTLYIGYAVTATESFQNLTTEFGNIIFNVTGQMARLFSFLEIECSMDNKKKRALSSFESIEFIDVFFKYPKCENYILKGVSFILNKGDKLSIVGVNGAGKTTIIKILLGFYNIDSGKILINGYPMEEYDILEVRKLFSVLFQEFVQYPLTLRENIGLSNLENMKDDELILKAMKESDLSEIYDKYKFSLDTYLTRRFSNDGIELSKGQYQKLALSRVYFKNSPIIVFDEPSAALDAEAEYKIFENYKKISKNSTGILISHRISSAKLSNKIIVLDGGRIVEKGTHEQLININNGVYAKLYYLQKQKYTIQEDNII